MMDVEDSDSVIHVDHAYASQDDCVERDPLSLEPEVVIKTEINDDMEIKIEEPDSYEIENREPLHFEPCDTTFFDLDEIHDNANIEILNHTTFETENVPPLLYLDIQDKSKENVKTKVPTSSLTSSVDKLLQENKKLNKTIARLKREKINCYSNIESNSKKFYVDLNKMHQIQCDLQREITSLKEENEKYKNQLICYGKLKKHHLDLETNILELRRQAHKFMKFEKIAIENIKTMKTEMDEKSNENKVVRNRLATAVKRLALFKAKFAKLVDINKMQATKAAECVELHTKLKSAVRMNKIYDVHLKTSKTQFEKQSKEQQRNLEIAKAEISSLKQMIKERDATCNLLKEKYKFSVEHQKQKIQANNEEAVLFKKRIMKMKDLLTHKALENDNLITKVNELEKNLLEMKTKTCDYCGL